MNEREIDGLLARFPKTRTQLPPEYQRIYEREYTLNRSGLSLDTKISSQLESWMHKRVARPPQQGSVLELGAGTLNHLRYEAVADGYDVIEPFTELYRDAKNIDLVDHFYKDIDEVPKDKKYQRVISIAVLEHLIELPKVVAQMVLHMRTNGTFHAGIPTEGGALWSLAWNTTTGIAYWLRNRLPYRVIMEHEHVNSAGEIESVVNYLFNDVSISRFPLPIFHASFYTYIEASGPNYNRADKILEWYK